MSAPTPSHIRVLLAIAYGCFILALFTGVTIILAYALAGKLSEEARLETWIESHALWIVHHSLMVIVINLFAGLWLIPLFFVSPDTEMWAKTMMVIGGILIGISWLFLFNAIVKGMEQYIKKKAVF